MNSPTNSLAPIVVPSSTNDNESEANRTEPEYKVHPWRWYVLLVVCLLNLSNASLWISFAPIATITDSFYGEGAADMFSLVYMIVSIPVGLVAMWGVDKFGIRTGVWLGGAINFLGILIRSCGSLDTVPTETRYYVGLTGQGVAAVAQPFIMYLPTKLAALWFPQKQRAIANTLGSMSNPLGILVAMVLSPILVHTATDIPRLNWIYLGPAAGVMLMGFAGVWRNKPPHPPTASAAEESLPFWPGIKHAVTQKSFWVLVITLGGGVGLFNAIYTLMQQILCVKGYSESFAGTCGALLIVGGLIGSAITGVFVDMTKRFQETAKICYSFAAVVAAAISVLTLYENQSVIIGVLMFSFGFFGFAIYPIGLEMGVEVTYPVAEATSAGIIIISGQVQGILYVVLMQILAVSGTEREKMIQQCSGSTDINDWTYSNILLVSMATLLATSMILFFWPKYHRLQAEQLKAAGASSPTSTVHDNPQQCSESAGHTNVRDDLSSVNPSSIDVHF